LDTTSTMERLFSKCTRYREILEGYDHLDDFRHHHPELLREFNLDVSTEEFLSAERGFTYADLHTMLQSRNITWLTPHAAVVRANLSGERSWMKLDDASYCFRFFADGKRISALARSPEHLFEICDVVLRLLAASVVHEVILNRDNSHHASATINAPALAYLMEHCQSLKLLTLYQITLDENHCRVLGSYSRPGLEIGLNSCRFTNAGARALAEVLGRNQGPTELTLCFINNSILADGLRGNSRLKILRSRTISSCPEGDREEVLAIVGGLRENKGLVQLRLENGHRFVNDEAWGAICDSLETHPTLEVLDLRTPYANASVTDAGTQAVLNFRVQALLNMMKMNMSIHTINLDSRHKQHKLYRESVIPYLDTNWLRPRLLAIQKTRPIAYRTKVLGRALLAARIDVNIFWMLLSGNAEVAFPSTNTTNTLVANLPTPATASASANVDVATAVAVAATGSTAAACNVVSVAPPAGKKRKACP
jgi:hypothetical protein